ncbi:MAG: anti-sigma factor, partial [Bacteroidota bacterium]
AEITAIELALEAYTTANALPPSPNLLSPLLAAVSGATTDKTVDKPSKTPPPPAKVGSSNNLLSWLPWLITLLLAPLAYHYFSGKSACEDVATTLQENNERLTIDYQESQAALILAEQRLRDATNPAAKGIILVGTESVPNSAAYVIYNPVINKTYFKATNLPPPPTGKQYQLWAIDASSGPHDLGVLALDLVSDTLLEIRHLVGVTAFAITLEDTGGKPTPDLNHLQVIGNVPG